jgi:hypothetical protein
MIHPGVEPSSVLHPRSLWIRVRGTPRPWIVCTAPNSNALHPGGADVIEPRERIQSYFSSTRIVVFSLGVHLYHFIWMLRSPKKKLRENLSASRIHPGVGPGSALHPLIKLGIIRVYGDPRPWITSFISEILAMGQHKCTWEERIRIVTYIYSVLPSQQ